MIEKLDATHFSEILGFSKMALFACGKNGRYHSAPMQQPKHHRQRSGWLAVGMLVIAAAIAPILIRFAQAEGVPSLSIIIWRLIIGAVVITPLALPRHQEAIRGMTAVDWGWAAGAGFFHAVGLICLFFALENTTVFINSILRRTSPLWTILLEMMLLSAIFQRRVWWGILLTLFGSLIIVSGTVTEVAVGGRPLVGITLSLLNALTLSIYIIIGRKVRNRLPFMAYTWVLFSTAALVAALFGWISGTPMGGFSMAGVVWIVWIALVAQVVGHLSANFSVRVFPATYVSIVLQLSVVISAIIAFFTFGETPTIWHIIGSSVIVLGIFIASSVAQS